MSPSEVGDYFLANPDQPVKLTLSSGDSLVISRPVNAFIEAQRLFVYNIVDGERRIANGKKLISIPNITLMEPFHGKPPRWQTRRGR